jgi:hypothetical protein
LRGQYWFYAIELGFLKLSSVKTLAAGDKIMKLTKKALLALCLMACIELAFAHTQSGSLGNSTSGKAATDVYIVNCYNDDSGAGEPGRLYLHVIDRLERDLKTRATWTVIPKISAQAIKGSSKTALSIDTVDGDGKYSPGISFAKGAGDYTVRVNKAAAVASCKATPKAKCKGIDTYTLEFHCESAGGSHAGTDWIMTQNQ